MKKLKSTDMLAPFVGDFTPGRACSAYFDFDKTWNRVEIMGKVGDEYLVNFVDYGNRDIVKPEMMSSDVFQLQIPKLANFAFIYGCKVIPERLKELRDLVFIKAVDHVCRFETQGCPLFSSRYVSIILPDQQNLKDLLLEKELVREFIMSESELDMEIRKLCQMVNQSPFKWLQMDLPSDTYFPCIMTAFLFRNLVWIQITGDVTGSYARSEIIRKEMSSLEEMKRDIHDLTKDSCYDEKSTYQKGIYAYMVFN